MNTNRLNPLVPTTTSPPDGAINSMVEAALLETGYWRQNEIAVSVADGWVTLAGQIEWDYQKRTALYAVRTVFGVRGVTDNILLRFAPLTLAVVSGSPTPAAKSLLSCTSDNGIEEHANENPGRHPALHHRQR